jgi:hypothetical protein
LLGLVTTRHLFRGIKMKEHKNVTPIRPDMGSSPQSATLPVARKVSNTELLTPRTQLERLIVSCTEAGLQAYRDAARARDAGDDFGAGLLRDAARRALDAARDAAEGLEGL